jgi:hypothetical protein
LKSKQEHIRVQNFNGANYNLRYILYIHDEKLKSNKNPLRMRYSSFGYFNKCSKLCKVTLSEKLFEHPVC